MPAYIDHIEDLHLVEKGGIIRSLTRMARVIGVFNTDYTALWQALQEAGIPPVPSNPGGAGFEALLLDERHAKVLHDDNGTIDVTLVYNHILDSDIQEMGTTVPGGLGTLYGKTKCSIQQKPTNLYTDPENPANLTDPNSVKTQITVQHKFPATDLDFPNKTVVQGGEVQVAVPMTTTQFSGYIQTSSPVMIANDLIATVNQKLWMSHGPLEWMCTEVGYKFAGFRSGGSSYYKFDFEFQHNPDQWEPYAVFIDQRTNKPPANLVKGVGYKQILYHVQKDYVAYFSSFFEGQQDLG